MMMMMMMMLAIPASSASVERLFSAAWLSSAADDGQQ